MAKWDMGDVGNNRIVVDDFLPEEDFKNILKIITDKGFEWHLADKITLEQKDDDIFFYLCHVFYNQTSIIGNRK